VSGRSRPTDRRPRLTADYVVLIFVRYVVTSYETLPAPAPAPTSTPRLRNYPFLPTVCFHSPSAPLGVSLPCCLLRRQLRSSKGRGCGSILTASQGSRPGHGRPQWFSGMRVPACQCASVPACPVGSVLLLAHKMPGVNLVPVAVKTIIWDSGCFSFRREDRAVLICWSCGDARLLSVVRQSRPPP
jgi:hypothetical protein